MYKNYIFQLKKICKKNSFQRKEKKELVQTFKLRFMLFKAGRTSTKSKLLSIINRPSYNGW
jgi:hypothetical protein